MINIDTRLLDKTSPDGLYLLCRITAYMNANRFCFPSNKSLAKATGFSESKVNRVKRELIEQGLLSCESRFRDDKSQTSSIYKIKTGLISVFVRGDEMSELTPPLVTHDTPPVVMSDTPPLSLVTTREVLEDLSIIHLEVLKGDVETSSTPFLDDEEMQSLEEKILAPKTTKDPTPQFRETPRPKAKRAKSENPTPTRPMFQYFEQKYTELNQCEKPIWQDKYAPALKKLHEILTARCAQKGIIQLDPLQPWKDFLDLWAQYLVEHPKEQWHRDNFNPMTLYSQFNSIISKLNAQPAKVQSERMDKWEKWAKQNGVV